MGPAPLRPSGQQWVMIPSIQRGRSHHSFPMMNIERCYYSARRCGVAAFHILNHNAAPLLAWGPTVADLELVKSYFKLTIHNNI